MVSLLVVTEWKCRAFKRDILYKIVQVLTVKDDKNSSRLSILMHSLDELTIYLLFVFASTLSYIHLTS